MRGEVQPSNILMIGPTGVGKTEIARRVAKMVDAPFIKVEATKFTEVGYVGRDVESIVRDLVEVAISQLHSQRLEQVKDEARPSRRSGWSIWRSTSCAIAFGRRGRRRTSTATAAENGVERRRGTGRKAQRAGTQAMLRLLDEHGLEEETVEIEIEFEDFDDFGGGEWPDDPGVDEGQPRFRIFWIR